MGVWRRLKRWAKLTVLRVVMRVARTRLYKFIRKIARASVVPLAVTAGAAVIGVCVASAVAFPVGYGALIGSSAGVVTVISVRWWSSHAATQRARSRTSTTFSILRRKEKLPDSSSRGTFVLASSSSSSRGTSSGKMR